MQAASVDKFCGLAWGGGDFLDGAALGMARVASKSVELSTAARLIQHLQPRFTF